MTRTVYQPQAILIAPPDSELISCDSYRAIVGKERLAYIEQTKNLAKCNNRLEALREWKVKQIELHTKDNKQ